MAPTPTAGGTCPGIRPAPTVPTGGHRTEHHQGVPDVLVPQAPDQRATQILNPNGSSTYLDVDSWTLAQDWGLANVDRGLLLQSITREGVYEGLTTTANPR